MSSIFSVEGSCAVVDRHSEKLKAPENKRTDDCMFLFASRYPTSPSMETVLYEIVVRSLSRSTGRSLGVHERVIVRSLGWSIDRSIYRLIDKQSEIKQWDLNDARFFRFFFRQVEASIDLSHRAASRPGIFQNKKTDKSFPRGSLLVARALKQQDAG